MKREEILAVIPIEYARFVVDAKLKPDEMTESERMVFHAAFVIGAEWALRQAVKRAREAA